MDSTNRASVSRATWVVWVSARLGASVVGLRAACEPGGLALPEGAVQFTPPAVDAQWWALTESCSGLSGDLSAISWYVVPNARHIPAGDVSAVVEGRWDSVGNRIVLADIGPRDGELVRHEMLHALLRKG